MVFAGFNRRLDELKALRVIIKSAVPGKKNAVGNPDDSQSIEWRTSADARTLLDDASRPGTVIDCANKRRLL